LVTPAPSESILIGSPATPLWRLPKRKWDWKSLKDPLSAMSFYTCDEAFFTGTAANVAPIAEIDHRLVGTGEIGPITQKISDIYGNIILGNNPKYMHWCTPVF